MSATDQQGYAPHLQQTDMGGEPNVLAFFFRAQAAKLRTATLVQVIAVTNSGDLSPVGMVDVQPMVNQVDGSMRALAHGTVHDLPYLRLQGGTNAIVMDPKVGDIGLAVFADRDISSVKASKARSNPGSGRRFDMADGLYIGGFLNGTPTQVVQFIDTGINVISPGTVTVQAPTVNVQAATAMSITSPVINLNGGIVLNGPVSSGAGTGAGPMNITGPVTVTNDVTAGGKSLKTHTHSQSGGGNTGAPN